MLEKLSFVIPCYNSEKTVTGVIEEIIEWVNQSQKYTYEIITVNDNSPDQVDQVLYQLAKKNTRIKVVNLAINRGKHAAMMAGYKYATGKLLVNLDDDGQCPLDQLENLIAAIEQGADIAMARYPQKKQSVLKNFGSAVNEWMARCLIAQPKDLQISNFSVIKRFVATEVLKYENPYPYISGLFLRTTAKIVNVDMEERERTVGSTNYTLKKSLSLWMNGFTAFSVKPLRIATFMGFLSATIGFLFGLYTVIHKIMYPMTPAGYSSMMAALLFIGGMIMLMLGLIGEYIGRIYISINNSPQYVIRETINIEQSTEGKIEEQ